MSADEARLAAEKAQREWEETERKRAEEDRRRALCRNDAVFVGHVQSTRTLMNMSEEFLFTDYTLAVDRWIYAKPSGSMTSQDAVQVVFGSLLGGTVIVGGRQLTTRACPLPTWEPHIFAVGTVASGITSFAHFKIEQGRVPLFSDKPFKDLESYIADIQNLAKGCSAVP